LRYYTTMHVINIQPELVFQALSDLTRIRVLRVLAAASTEACLCELVDSLLEPQYKLSRHLKVLRQAGLLAAEKDGRFVYHQIVTRHAHLKKLYATIRILPDGSGTFAADLRRFLDRMRLRESGRCRIGIQTPSLAASARDHAV
jgi:ArsR family transcriptional regulator